MSDLISREDAIKAVTIAVLADKDEIEALEALPSADAVSMEEHIKELNDLAVEWKAKFAKAEKITDEIYDETMAKVAKECEECKERLRNIRPSAEAEPKWNCTANFVAEQLEKLKDMTDEERIKLLHILFPSAEAEPSLKAIKRQIDEHWYLDPPSAEAVHGWRTGKPKENGEYMVTLDAWGHRYINIMHYAKPQMPNRNVDGMCWYRSDDEWGDVVYDDNDILAWMPLPTPYKGGGSE